jgi:hypothetical protein
MTQAFFSGAYVEGQTVDVLGTISSTSSGTVVISSGTIVISGGTVATQHLYVQDNLLTDAVVYNSGASTLNVSAYQNLTVDVFYGTAVAGSIQTSIMGIEPQSGMRTSTILAGSWYSGTTGAGQRLSGSQPLGALVAVSWTVVGSILGVYITGEVSS